MTPFTKTKIIDIGEAHITVRSSDGWTEIDRNAIIRELIKRLATDTADGLSFQLSRKMIERIGYFAAIYTQTAKVDGDLGFQWPGEAATMDELVATMDCMTLLPAGAIKRWAKALDEIDFAPGDPDLSPDMDADPK